MLEKIGQPKTHLECKKMIKEVNKRDSDTINYREFLDMMLGSKNSVLRLYVPRISLSHYHGLGLCKQLMII